jgi:hypothetical protein
MQAQAAPKAFPTRRHQVAFALSLEIMPGGRPPFQGDSLAVRLPRAEAPIPQSDSTELVEVPHRGHWI